MSRLSAMLLAVVGVFMICSTSRSQEEAPSQVGVVSNGGFEEIGEKDFPRDWMPVTNAGKAGAKVAVEVTNDAHSGKNAARIRMEGEGVEVGLNRTYLPGQGQGAMLGVMKGGIEFWYKAVSAGGGKMTLNVIPMKADGIEGGGTRRATFEIPESHVGDGQWHRVGVKYDFTAYPEVKFIQIGPRVSRGSGEMILDDIRWVEKVGPMLAFKKTWITETKGSEGGEFTLQFSVKNDGDQPAEAKGRIVAPPYLRVETIADSVKIAPDDWRDLVWRIIGRRDKTDVIQLFATVGDSVAETRVELAPKLEPPVLAFSKFIVQEGEPFTLSCTLRNSGTATAKGVEVFIAPSDGVELAEKDSLQRRLDVPAGGKTSTSWRLRATRQGWSSDVLARVTLGEARQEFRSAKLVVGARHDSGATAFLGNDRVRLAFPKNEFGYGVGFIEIKEGLFGWKRAGAIPRLARLVWQPAEGVRSDSPIYGDAPQIARDGDTTAAVFRREFSDADGNQWTVSVRFSLGAGAERFDVESSASCSKDVKLLCFEGPMVYAGEGGFGSEKTEAVFPGLEWLEGDEISSSTLDITTPEHVRYVPHPNRVTIPCIGVLNKKTLVGILWDARRKWDGANDRVSAVFASPNHFEGTSSHLMGLFVPSVPEWVTENDREASTPYALKAGQALSLKMQILAEKDAADALAAMDRWFELYGVIEPRPYPRSSAEAEIKFSMQAYFQSLWIPEEGKWWPYLGGPKLHFKPVVPPFFVHDLLKAAQIVKDAAAQKQYRDRIALMLPHLKGGGDDKVCFFLGSVEDRIKGMQVAASGSIQSQGNDGEWRFNANRRDQGIFKGYDYRELGPDGAVELGTCAANARALMRCARITGNNEVLEAGLKALRFMTRFRVPRAAQVWEVPVHTPDILAASHAVVAYLDAYRLTGDERWHAEARRWARAGLPFLYFWDDDKFDFMRYASIAVFGATWYKGNWMGRPVQWCGLDHAYALLRFSEFDQTFPWRKVGEGVTVSGMYQQSAEEKDIALWPDYSSLIDGKRCPWVFAPPRITQNVYWGLGQDIEPYTVLVRAEGGVAHITAPSKVAVTAEAVRADKTLEFTSDLAVPDPYYILVMPIAKPDLVTLDGKSLPIVSDVEASAQSAARYTPSRGMLVIKVAKPGRALLSVGPLKRIEVPLSARAVKAIDFQFNRAGDDEGWTPVRDIEPISVANGAAVLKITGVDPYMVRHNLDVNAAGVRTIVVHMKVTAGEGAQIYWTTKDSPAFGEDKVVRFAPKADGQFHEYAVDMAGHSLWAGVVTALRLDPVSGSKAVGAVAEIDFIKAK